MARETCTSPNATDTKQSLVRPGMHFRRLTALYTITFYSDFGIPWPLYDPFVSVVRREVKKPYGLLPIDFGSLAWRRDPDGNHLPPVHGFWQRTCHNIFPVACTQPSYLVRSNHEFVLVIFSHLSGISGMALVSCHPLYRHSSTGNLNARELSSFHACIAPGFQFPRCPGRWNMPQEGKKKRDTLHKSIACSPAVLSRDSLEYEGDIPSCA